jgi:pyruvate kinase
MAVTGKKEDQVFCRVEVGGRVTERRGVTTPGKSPTQPFLNEKTTESLKFAAEQESDFVALSVITEDSHVHSAKAVLNSFGSNPMIITKIERAEALNNIDSILEASDAIMVARGDMGVEVPVERVPIIQKDLISRCNTSGKPVITATQMLESMIDSPVPTRAEVTDVANAIFDGTDAIMLSGETSVGKYPANAVNVMSRVAKEAEAALPYDSMMRAKAFQLEAQTDDAISYDACRTAHQLNAKAIVAFTESGSTAGRVSKYRPKAPILAITPSEKVQQALTLRWGVTPLTVEDLTLVEDFFGKGEEMAVAAMGLKRDELVVLVAGLPIGIAGGTNLLRVLRVGETANHT